MNLRDYQIEPARVLSTTRRGILKAPAGSGKTIIAAGALSMALERKRETVKVLWIANTIEQLNQGRDACKHFAAIGYYAQINFIHPVALKPQAVAAMDYNLVIVDECHHAAAAEWANVISACNRGRWGLSATPEREDDLRDRVFALLGDVVCEVTRQEVLNAGKLAPCRVVWHRLGEANRYHAAVESGLAEMLPAALRKIPAFARTEAKQIEVANRIRFQLVKQQMAGDTLIDEKVQDLLNDADGSTLVLLPTIEHCNRMADQCGGIALHSKMGAKNRTQAIDAIRAGDITRVFATQLADEGLDVPRLSAAIMVAPSRSSRLAIQRTGRVLRSFEGKAEGVIHDFIGEAHYFLSAQANKRRAIYKQLRYEQ